MFLAFDLDRVQKPSDRPSKHMFLCFPWVVAGCLSIQLVVVLAVVVVIIIIVVVVVVVVVVV